MTDDVDPANGDVAYEHVIATIAAESASRQAELRSMIARLIVALVAVSLIGLAGIGVIAAQTTSESNAATADRQRYLRRIDEQSAQLEALANTLNRRPAALDYTRCAMAYVTTLADASGDPTAPEVVAARAALKRAGETNVDAGEPVVCLP